ncbi:hypothetical protein [Vibrio phage vB_VmeM-Yong XC32]|nr:hypothetical protein [Vibrio phage vB_VmeM-Yong XC31]QAX96316.1 hypothetical protein [Vibrio phage vB_VmeM-Yong XC32]QAX96634.1 hypothetical protein [Vibrio phage vB_VmeM-Yong MS31]QAX96952.1 hypothetical protein [Vibrio phage vB_VmeM-Yong MS32]
MMQHDMISRKDIPAIYRRSLSVCQIRRWPEGGFGAPKVSGKTIINNTKKTIYVTRADGIVEKIKPLDDKHREGILKQLYHALGVHNKWEDDVTNFAKSRRKYSIRLKPFRELKRSDWHNPHSDHRHQYETAGWEGVTSEDWVTITETFNVIDNPEMDIKLQAINNFVSEANAIDAKNSLTYALRHDEKEVFILDFLFQDTLEKGPNYSDISFSRVVDHQARTSRNKELLDFNFDLKEESEFATAEELLSQRKPCVLWSTISPRLVKYSHQGYFVPEHGLTFSFDQDAINKALSFASPEADNYMARTGIKIIIPKRVGSSGSVYVRIGKHVTKVNCTDAEAYDSTMAMVYTYDGYGEEILSGVEDVSQLLKKGIMVNAQDGAKWHLPFFERREDALNYFDEEDQARVNVYLDQVKEVEAELLKVKKELAKYKKAEEDRKGGKLRNITNVVAGFFTNAAVQKALIGIVIGGIAAVLTALGVGKED